MAQRKRKPIPGRVALVIGNAAYDKPLSNPVRDATLITTTLESLGFTIFGGAGGSTQAGENLDRPAMYKVIQDFEHNIQPGGEVVIYYAGHGVQFSTPDGTDNYLVPIGADLANANLELQLVSLRRVISRAAQLAGGSGKVFAFLDACRDNPLTNRQRQALMAGVAEHVAETRPQEIAASTRGGLATLRIKRDDDTARTFIALATAPGDVAYDGDPDRAKNSPFAAALAKHMRTRGLEIEQLYNRVSLDVKDEVGGMGLVQDPWNESNLTEEYYFKRRTLAPIWWLGLAGLVLGLAMCWLLFEQNKWPDPVERPWIFGLGAFFGLVAAGGTMLWGSRRWQDAVFAFIGPVFGFALRDPDPAVQDDRHHQLPGTTAGPDIFATAFQILAVLAGLLYALGTMAVLATRPRPVSKLGIATRVVEWAIPVFITGGLLLLQYFLSFRNVEYTALALITLLSGVIYATGAVLGCRAQRGNFSGFGAVTGAITVGLSMALFFVIYAYVTHTMDSSVSTVPLILADRARRAVARRARRPARVLLRALCSRSRAHRLVRQMSKTIQPGPPCPVSACDAPGTRPGHPFFAGLDILLSAEV